MAHFVVMKWSWTKWYFYTIGDTWLPLGLCVRTTTSWFTPGKFNNGLYWLTMGFQKPSENTIGREQEGQDLCPKMGRISTHSISSFLQICKFGGEKKRILFKRWGHHQWYGDRGDNSNEKTHTESFHWHPVPGVYISLHIRVAGINPCDSSSILLDTSIYNFWHPLSHWYRHGERAAHSAWFSGGVCHCVTFGFVDTSEKMSLCSQRTGFRRKSGNLPFVQLLLTNNFPRFTVIIYSLENIDIVPLIIIIISLRPKLKYIQITTTNVLMKLMIKRYNDFYWDNYISNCIDLGKTRSSCVIYS